MMGRASAQVGLPPRCLLSSSARGPTAPGFRSPLFLFLAVRPEQLA